MAMTIKIKKVKGLVPCYSKYPIQCTPQGAYIELDCRTGELIADYNGEIGNTVPFSVWYGHQQRGAIPPCASGEAINEMLDNLEPHCQEILDGYDTRFDGSNHVSDYSEAAQEAIDAVESIVHSCDPETVWIIEDWWDWFNSMSTLLAALQDATGSQDFIDTVKSDTEYHPVAVLTNTGPLDWALECEFDEEDRSKFPDWFRTRMEQ